MNFEPVPLMRDTSSFNRSTIVIDNMLLHFGKQDFIAQNMPNNAIPNLNTCNRSYSASLKQREFLCRSILKSPIHQIAEEYGIHINKKKTRIVKISSTYKFLQIKYSLTDSGKVIKRINPKRVTTMRRKLKKLAVKVKNEEITYENVENMFRGWMGSFYKLLSKEQRKNLIGLYEDLFEKSITIISKRMIITDKIK